MLGKAVLICMLLGAVSAEPVRRSLSLPDDLSSLLGNKFESFELSLQPETINSIVKMFKSLIGYKITALSLSINVLKWIASNFMSITFGGIIALGFCKMTGKCNLNYDQSLKNLSNFITPERLEMAETLLMTAVKRFTQEDVSENDINQFEINFE